jgi:hypothetical protein
MMADPNGIDWSLVDAVNAVTEGSGPPPFHIADQERLHAALPPCDVSAADRATLTAVRLRAFPATVWLPAPATAEPMELPELADGTVWQGWEWPSGASLLLDLHPDAALPGLHFLEGALPGAQCAVVDGRPMRVDRRDPDETGRDFRAWMRGFLDAQAGVQARCSAAVAAPSAAERDALLAALLTLTLDPPAGAREPARTPPGG